MGTADFIQTMKDRIEDKVIAHRRSENWSGEPVDEIEEHRASRLLKRALDKLGHRNVESITGQERYLVAAWLRDQSNVAMPWLRKTFGLKSSGGVRNGIHLVRKRLVKDRGLQKQRAKLEGMLQ